MSGYGYGSYGGGYGDYEIVLGFYDTARGELTGPGSTAYAREGDFTSYAHEGDNGGLFTQVTFTHGGAYQVATSYSYAAGYVYYGADGGSVGTGAFLNQESYSSYAFTSGTYEHGVLDYSFSSSAHSAYGGYDLRTSIHVSQANYVDGSYNATYRTASGLFSDAGEAIPGSASQSYSTTSYDASTGDLTSYHS